MRYQACVSGRKRETSQHVIHIFDIQVVRHNRASPPALFDKKTKKASILHTNTCIESKPKMASIFT